MRIPRSRLWPVLACLLFALALAPPVSAQVFTGRIEITVVDASGAVIPGVAVELSGPQQGSMTTLNDGTALFLNLHRASIR
jgi:hypothetical protein